jgi:hypothetical protein
MNAGPMIRTKRPAVVFIAVAKNEEYSALAKRFVDSYHRFGPGELHDTFVVCNAGPLSLEEKDLFKDLPNLSFLDRANEGWDIGGFIAASNIIKDCTFAVYFGGCAFLQRGGWLSRMARVWDKTGPGFYGGNSSFEVSPHLNTSGFWCLPEWVSKYPYKVFDRQTRYDFEHRDRAMWRLVHRESHPVRLVTWDSEHIWPEWRLPPNIYRRGDQSNCLNYFRHSLSYGMADPATKRVMEGHCDTLTDPPFLLAIRVGLSNGSLRRLRLVK